MRHALFAGILALAAVFGLLGPTDAVRAEGLSKGQTIYLPVYSHIYHGNKGKVMNLAVTVSVHNIDPERSLSLVSVDYHDTMGKLVRRFLDAPRTLGPMETVEFLVDEEDDSGGSGANCLVVWKSEDAVNPPVVESVMIGARSGQGVSFLSVGRVIH